PEPDYDEYISALKNAGEALPILRRLGIDVCEDNLSAMEYLMSEEAEGFFDALSKRIGAKALISCFHKPDGGMILSPDVYGKVRTRWESVLFNDSKEQRENEFPGRTGRVLQLMGKLAARGYYEVPVALQDTILRLCIRREADRYRVIFKHGETGGIVMHVTLYPESIHALVVGDNEEALGNLRESNLLPVKLQKLFGKDTECTYLFKEDLSKIRNFYSE
ncbi:MAG: hypothetical protein J5898_08595, partial [Lachnospiraceae bacterium]|nr:hypothetical protein [Lachnospiraceae bacterium]